MEQLIAALLEGTAPSSDAMQKASTHDAPVLLSTPESESEEELWEYTKDRQNIFDDQPMELANVNYGKSVADLKACPHPNWQLTRLTGGAYVDKIVIGSNGLPTYQNIVSPGLNQCYNGDCNLTGEQDAINKDNCAATVSVYSVDYDAPTSAFTKAKPQFQKTLQRLGNAKPSKRHTLSREA